jgi:hypothetical protein
MKYIHIFVNIFRVLVKTFILLKKVASTLFSRFVQFRKAGHWLLVYISDAQFTAPTRVPNLRNTKYILFANIFRRITPFKKSTTYLDLALKDKHNDT